MLSAAELGLGSVYLMGSIAALRSSPELMERLSLPKGFAPIAAVALGHPTEPLSLRTSKRKIALKYFD